MGLTLADRHKRIYYKNRSKGLTHEETLERVPLEMREQFLKDINSTFSESHFGIGDFEKSLIKLTILFVMAILAVGGIVYISSLLK